MIMLHIVSWLVFFSFPFFLVKIILIAFRCGIKWIHKVFQIVKNGSLILNSRKQEDNDVICKLNFNPIHCSNFIFCSSLILERITDEAYNETAQVFSFDLISILICNFSW